jgi:hypothetical protein
MMKRKSELGLALINISARSHMDWAIFFIFSRYSFGLGEREQQQEEKKKEMSMRKNER